MKLIKSKLLQKAEGRKRGKYEVTLEVSDYDLEMFEELGGAFASRGVYSFKSNVDKEVFAGATKFKSGSKNADPMVEDPVYNKYLKKVFGELIKLWKRYDD